ncbi:MAG: CopG family transcriptional regulator [Armatimonadota bacterium]|nr:CopG family transcriptional regulator [Armatimonadota bacterium]
MVRTQVQLTEAQVRALRQLAAERGVSVAELIRQSLELFLQSARTQDREERRRALAAAGRFRSGLHDLAAEHDRYLEDAYRP